MLNFLNKAMIIAFFATLVCVVGSCAGVGYGSYEPETYSNVVVPDWAPPYDNPNLVRYYYFPDIEVYYDVWNQDFVYLEDGDWVFSAALPAIYAGFDLYDCFIVVLDYRVYEPWMHHHYYVSHYPRYYYRSFYNVSNTYEIRGFNENRGREIRLGPEERTRLEEASRNRPERERMTPPPPEQRSEEFTREPQQMRYYGPNVGRPVRVERQMTKPAQGHEQQGGRGQRGEYQPQGGREQRGGREEQGGREQQGGGEEKGGRGGHEGRR